MASNEKN